MSEFLNPFQYAGIIAYLAALIATNLLIKANLNDAPNEARKLHIKSTPTGGGLAIIWGAALACFYMQLSSEYIENKQFILVIGMASFFGIIGFIDDLLSLGSKRRLALLIVISFSIGLSEYGVRFLPIWGQFNLQLLPIIGAIGTMLWLIVIINCVNFMDGANGLSIGSSAIALLFLSGLALMHNDMGSASLGLIGACACFGFLTYNALTGSIFAGDVGSYFVGGFIGLLGLLLVKSGVSPYLVALCVLPILSDAIVTIFYRLSKKQNIFSPHNLHIYQRLVARGDSHVSVAMRWWGQTIICGVFALLIDKYFRFEAIAFFIAIAALFTIVLLQVRKKLD